MAKITRVTQKEFGINGPVGDFGQFGSLKAGVKTFTKDLTAIQALNNFQTGWGAAVIGGFRPALEDMNSLFFLAFQQICYMFQTGIPEWDAATTYYINGIVQLNGVIYVSTTDSNVGNSPEASIINWGYPVGMIQTGFQVACGLLAAPTGYLLCDGSAVSRSTYARLFSAIGTRYGAGNGSTTFNVPNKKGKVSVGVDASQTEFDTVGKNGGSKTHTLTVDEVPAHGHTEVYRDNADGGTAQPCMTQANGSQQTFTSDLTGGGQAHNNLQPYEVDTWIIRI